VPAVQDLQRSPFTVLGAEPAQYMLAFILAMVGFLAWKISQARLAMTLQDIDRQDTDEDHVSTHSLEATAGTH
jgi:hypothetical protein